METGNSGQTEKQNAVIRSWMSGWEHHGSEARGLPMQQRCITPRHLTPVVLLTRPITPRFARRMQRSAWHLIQKVCHWVWLWDAPNVWVDHNSEDWKLVLKLRVVRVWLNFRFSCRAAGCRGQRKFNKYHHISERSYWNMNPKLHHRKILQVTSNPVMAHKTVAEVSKIGSL